MGSRSTHPGKTLGAELRARGLSASALALRLHVPANRISDLIRGRRSVTPDTALRLGRVFGMSPEFWTRLQANHDLAQARLASGETVEREVIPL